MEPCVHEACPMFRGQAWRVSTWSLVSVPFLMPAVQPWFLGSWRAAEKRTALPPHFFMGVPGLRVSLSLSTPTLGPQCSKSCGSGTRRRQVICTIGPPGHCADLQSSKPAEVEPCNRQPCHLPQGEDGSGRVVHLCFAPGCLLSALLPGAFPWLLSHIPGHCCLCCCQIQLHKPMNSPYMLSSMSSVH